MAARSIGASLKNRKGIGSCFLLDIDILWTFSILHGRYEAAEESERDMPCRAARDGMLYKQYCPVKIYRSLGELREIVLQTPIPPSAREGLDIFFAIPASSQTMNKHVARFLKYFRSDLKMLLLEN